MTEFSGETFQEPLPTAEDTVIAIPFSPPNPNSSEITYSHSAIYAVPPGKIHSKIPIDAKAQMLIAENGGSKIASLSVYRNDYRRQNGLLISQAGVSVTLFRRGAPIWDELVKGTKDRQRELACLLKEQVRQAHGLYMTVAQQERLVREPTVPLSLLVLSKELMADDLLNALFPNTEILSRSVEPTETRLSTILSATYFTE